MNVIKDEQLAVTNMENQQGSQAEASAACLLAPHL